MKPISYSKLAAVVACIFIISGCQSTTGDVNNMSLSESNQALSELEADTSCTASFQCKVLEVGQRACGGPSRYAVYSTLNIEQDNAEKIAQQVTKQEKLANQSNGASDCPPVIPVQALCISNQCKTFNIK